MKLIALFLSDETHRSLPFRQLRLPDVAPIKLDDLYFHPCVDLEAFSKNHPKIHFTPPGSVPFQLMRYRIANQKRLIPFQVCRVFIRTCVPALLLYMHAYNFSFPVPVTTVRSRL